MSERRARDAALFGGRATAGEAIGEICRGRADGIRRHRGDPRRARLPAPLTLRLRALLELPRAAPVETTGSASCPAFLAPGPDRSARKRSGRRPGKAERWNKDQHDADLLETAIRMRQSQRVPRGITECLKPAIFRLPAALMVSQVSELRSLNGNAPPGTFSPCPFTDIHDHRIRQRKRSSCPVPGRP